MTVIENVRATEFIIETVITLVEIMLMIIPIVIITTTPRTTHSHQFTPAAATVIGAWIATKAIFTVVAAALDMDTTVATPRAVSCLLWKVSRTYSAAPTTYTNANRFTVDMPAAKNRNCACARRQTQQEMGCHSRHRCIIRANSSALAA